MLVAAGILLSRIAGLIRQRVFAHYLGLGDAADALSAAFRVPNLVQNLLGEGSLSASFIPVYARLRAEGREEDAANVARATLALLALVTALAVLAGVLAAPFLVDLLFAGFAEPKRDLTVQLARILFPGIGLLVLSAWCLGVLNSHGRFFLSYAAPVAWNLAIIAATLVAATRGAGAELAVAIAWGAVFGSLLQLGIQLPAVRGLLRPGGLDRTGEVRTVVRNFGPAVLSRGVVQLGAWVDMLIASFLGTGAVAALANAQMLSLLPVSLFGISISAAALPAMARERAGPDAAGAIRTEVEQGWRRIAYFVVPCAAVFLGLGQVVAGTVFQTGAFGAEDSAYLWWILAGSAVGLLATTSARLAASALFALGDTRTPFRIALVRLAVGVGLGVALGVLLPRSLGLDPRIGAAGLTLAAGLAGWVELTLLRRALAGRIGAPRFGAGRMAALWALAAVSVGAGWLVLALGAGALGPLWGGLVVLITVAAGYLGLTWAAGLAAPRDWAGVLRRAG